MQDIAKKIIATIKKNFPNGMRDDFIDTSKLLRIYLANHADENISREFIAEVIRTNGIDDGGKFYFLSDVERENILHFVTEILGANSIVYYSAAHKKHADFFADQHIFSPDVLKKFLQEIDDGNFYFDEFFSACRMTRLDYEVAKIFMASKNSLSLDDLQEKLPYVPTEKISAVLSDAKKYLSASGKFVSVSKIQFDFDEIHAAQRQIISAVNANGYAAPEDYDLTSNFALNPEVAEKDLRNVIYEKFFAVDFLKRGKKLFKQGTVAKKEIGAVNRLRKFIAEHDELSTDKLFDFAQNLGLAQHVAIHYAHEKMIRVEKNLFIKDSLINFDVAGVDEALTPFVQGKIISLQAVTSFTGFPSVAGYSWNLFLLESFLRKYSRRYVYTTAAANSANVGAIYPKSLKLEDYLDVQAAVVVQENIPLEKSAVEDFLVGQGFRARRIDKVNQRVIIRAQEIIDEGF